MECNEQMIYSYYSYYKSRSWTNTDDNCHPNKTQNYDSGDRNDHRSDGTV